MPRHSEVSGGWRHICGDSLIIMYNFHLITCFKIDSFTAKIITGYQFNWYTVYVLLARHGFLPEAT